MNHTTTPSQDRDFKSTLINELGGAEWVLDWVEQEFNPEDVFNFEMLKTWALENGFVEKEG
jgi:hypothetical protein